MDNIEKEKDCGNTKESISIRAELEKVTMEAKKIVGISPISEDDIDRFLINQEYKADNELTEASTVREFLKLEIKMGNKEIGELKIVKIENQKKEEADRLYLHMKDEESVQYIYKKAAQVINPNTKVHMLALPKLYNRFADLSKNTYDARKNNKNLKTQIRLGKLDLILLVKNKGDNDWINEPNLECLGDIAEPDMLKTWPNKKILAINSPPPGRPSYKDVLKRNVHQLSPEHM